MSEKPSGLELTKELLGTVAKPEDNAEAIATKQKRHNLITDCFLTISAGLTVGAISGTFSSLRMLTDKKSGVLPKTLQDFPTSLLVQRIYRGHFMRGVIAAAGVLVSHLALRESEDIYKWEIPPVVMGFVPGAVGGALMGNYRSVSPRIIPYAIVGGVLGAAYWRFTDELKLLRVKLPYEGKRGFEDSLR